MSLKAGRSPPIGKASPLLPRQDIRVFLVHAGIPLVLVARRDQPGPSVVAEMEIGQFKRTGLRFLDGVRVKVRAPRDTG